MKKAREVLEDPVVNRRKPVTRQGDERLRRLFKQAQRATDPRQQANLIEQFMREFYDGAR